MSNVGTESGRTIPGVAAAFLVLSSFAVLPTTYADDKIAAELWESTNWNGKLNLPAQAIRHRLVKVDLKLLQSPLTKRIKLSLPDGSSITIQKKGEDHIGKRGFVWHGEIEGDVKSLATFSILNNVLVGDVVSSRGKMFRVDHVAAGVHVVTELAPARFPPEARSQLPGKLTAQPLKSSVSCPEDSPDRIDIMVLYTEAACAAANNDVSCTAPDSHDPIEAKIYEAVSETNQTYINSNVNHRLSLVHLDAIGPYVEGNSLGLDLDRLKLVDSAETSITGVVVSYLDNVHDLRTLYTADAVVLITRPTNHYPDGAACGFTPQMTTNEHWLEKEAFSVVPVDCATGNFSFGHELGHILGADHDKDSAQRTHPEVYAQGFTKPQPTQADVPRWRTVMAENINACFDAARVDNVGCVRLPNWSNHEVLHHGDQMGIWEADGTDPLSADNRLVLNKTAATVSNYRHSLVCGGDVWMKDTWQDSGEEPDPAQADKPMSKSPYIWVRRNLDPDQGRLHQHQHENPEFGSTNWGYVKIHNGGPTMTGHLELRYAKASTGLIWDDPSWIVIGSEEITISTNSTRIVPFQWDDVPEPGHYCLIAKWTSPDDQITIPPESTLGSIVRAKNNIVWRNVNIVDLAETSTVAAEVLVANPTSAPMQATIDVLPSSGGQQFFTFGVITLELDQNLGAAWSKGGSKSSGLIVKGKILELTPFKGSSKGSTIQNLSLAPGFKGKVKITFHRAASYPKGTFTIDVVQSRLIDGRNENFGAVSYEIHTKPPK